MTRVTPTADDYRIAAKACRKAATVVDDGDNADTAQLLLDDLGMGNQLGSWVGIAALLESKADALDPPPPSIVLYTVAPKDFDGFSVRELDPHAGTDDRGRTIRKVSVEERDCLWFATRCGSGLHAVATEDEARRFATIWRLK